MTDHLFVIPNPHQSVGSTKTQLIMNTFYAFELSHMQYDIHNLSNWCQVEFCLSVTLFLSLFIGKSVFSYFVLKKLFCVKV